MKKYKMRKLKKSANPYFIFIIFVVFIIILSTGYSLLSDNLTITGQANIKKYSGGVGSYEEIEDGNSTYSYKVLSTWPNGSNGTTYQIEILVTNLDEDIESWELSFNLPDGFLVTSNIWQASSVTLVGNTVTLKAAGWNGYIPAETDYTFNFILDFDRDVDFYITDLILNGKVMSLAE